MTRTRLAGWLTAAALLGLGCDTPARYPATDATDLQLRLVEEAAPADVRPEDLQDEVLIDQADIAYLFISEDEAGGADGFGLGVELKPAAAARFAEITRANVGQRLAMISRGEILSAPTIREEIRGSIMVTGQRDRAAVEAQLATILGEALR